MHDNLIYFAQRRCEIELQSNQILTYEGCFGFHEAAIAKKSRLSAHLEPNQY